MSYTTPILTAGIPSGQTIYESVSEARQPVGTVGSLNDGRRYAYACNRGAALAAGVIAKGTEPSADADELVVNSAAAIGDTSVDVAFTGTKTYAANELVGGYLEISDDAGEGHYYRITGNPAITAALDPAVIDIEPIRVALTTSTTVSVVPSLYSAVLIADANLTQTIAGVANAPIGAGSTTPQYFWIQTGGPCSVLTDATVSAAIVGNVVQPSAAVAGAVEPNVTTTAQDMDPIVGRCLSLLSIDTEYAMIDLQL